MYLQVYINLLQVGDVLNIFSAVFFGIHMLRTEHIARITKKENFLPLLGYEVGFLIQLSLFPMRIETDPLMCGPLPTLVQNVGCLSCPLDALNALAQIRLHSHLVSLRRDVAVDTFSWFFHGFCIPYFRFLNFLGLSV